MKKLVSILFIFLALFMMNCSSPQQESQGETTADKQLALEVEGMVCAVGCAKYIEKQVSKMEGVSSCVVNYEEGTASIEFSSKVTNQEEILESISQINDGQYKVSVVALTGKSGKSTESPKIENKEELNETKVSFQFPELLTYFMSRIIR